MRRGDFITPPDDEDQQVHAPAQDTTLQALAAFGLAPEGQVACESDEIFYLWPENLPPVMLWRDLQSQWRFGMAGRTGLDYGGVLAHFELCGIPQEERARLHADIRTMERTALREWAAMRERQQGR